MHLGERRLKIPWRRQAACSPYSLGCGEPLSLDPDVVMLFHVDEDAKLLAGGDYCGGIRLIPQNETFYNMRDNYSIFN